jgi:hypothetical protein
MEGVWTMIGNNNMSGLADDAVNYYIWGNAIFNLWV